MAIVSSTYTPDAHTQTDGRRYVSETHTDSTGVVHTLSYLAEPGADYAAILAAHAAQLSESLAAQEYEEVLSGT